MATSIAGAWLVVGLLSACTARPGVELDGPVAYITHGTPGTSTTLQLTANGAASYHVEREAGVPRDFTGIASAAALAALRDDIAAADLGSLPSEYTCPDPACDAPEPSRSILVEAGGAATDISVDARISDAQLPAGLVKVFQDLDAIAVELSSSAGS